MNASTFFMARSLTSAVDGAHGDGRLQAPRPCGQPPAPGRGHVDDRRVRGRAVLAGVGDRAERLAERAPAVEAAAVDDEARAPAGARTWAEERPQHLRRGGRRLPAGEDARLADAPPAPALGPVAQQ